MADLLVKNNGVGKEEKVHSKTYKLGEMKSLPMPKCKSCFALDSSNTSSILKGEWAIAIDSIAGRLLDW